MAAAARYKLTYFDIRGLGEPIRLMFYYSGTAFEDYRITREAWTKIKPTTPTGKIPILEEDGRVLVESGAIYRYLGSKFSLKPKCKWENAQMESAIDYYQDFRNEIRPFFRTAAGLEDGNLGKLYEEVFVPASDRVFHRYTDILSKSKSGFLADGGFSWGDFVLAEKIFSLKHMDQDFADRFPYVVDYQERVYDIEKLRDYYKSRKFSII